MSEKNNTSEVLEKDDLSERFISVIKSVCENNEIDIESTDIKFDTTTIHGTEPQRIEFFKAYAGYFGEVTNPKNTKTNPFHKSKYAPLDEVMNTIRPVMSKYGLSIIQVPTFSNNLLSIGNIIMHKGGAYLTLQKLDLKPSKLDIQSLGGAITYGRRYTASSIAGVMAEEDTDGNPNNTPPQKPTKPSKPVLPKEVQDKRSKIVALAKEMSDASRRDEAIAMIGTADLSNILNVEIADTVINKLTNALKK